MTLSASEAFKGGDFVTFWRIKIYEGRRRGEGRCQRALRLTAFILPTPCWWLGDKRRFETRQQILFIVILSFRLANSDPDTERKAGVSARHQRPRLPLLLLLLSLFYCIVLLKDIQSLQWTWCKRLSPARGQTVNFPVATLQFMANGRLRLNCDSERSWQRNIPLPPNPFACVPPKDQTGSFDFGRTRAVPPADM